MNIFAIYAQGVLEWIMGERDSHWNTLLVRDVLDNAYGVGYVNTSMLDAKRCIKVFS
jgi:hypothetical protein